MSPDEMSRNRCRRARSRRHAAAGRAARSTRRCRSASRRDRGRTRRRRCWDDPGPSELPQLSVDAEHGERAVGRRDLHRPEHEALRRIAAIDPDRRIVWIPRQRIGRERRRDGGRARFRRRSSRVSRRRRRFAAANRRDPQGQRTASQRAQRIRIPPSRQTPSTSDSALPAAGDSGTPWNIAAASCSGSGRWHTHEGCASASG